jgi:hypothetical protein
MSVRHGAGGEKVLEAGGGTSRDGGVRQSSARRVGEMTVVGDRQRSAVPSMIGDSVVVTCWDRRSRGLNPQTVKCQGLTPLPSIKTVCDYVHFESCPGRIGEAGGCVVDVWVEQLAAVPEGAPEALAMAESGPLAGGVPD